MSSNRSTLNSIIKLIDKLKESQIKDYIFRRSSYLYNIISFKDYNLINDGHPLPWEIEAITMLYVLGYPGRNKEKKRYDLNSKEGKNILFKLQEIIKNQHDDYKKEEVLSVFSKMLIQQSEHQKNIHNILYRYSCLYGFKGTDPAGNNINMPTRFALKFGYSYEEHENFIFFCFLLLQDYKKNDIKQVFRRFFNRYEKISSNISETIHQINVYQERELAKVEYDWLYVFKTVNVFPIINTHVNKYELILPHRLIYSLTDGFVNKFTHSDDTNRNYLGYSIQDYLYNIIRTSQYFDLVLPEQKINNSPDVICTKGKNVICFESKLHVYKNSKRSINFTEVDNDFSDFIGQIEKSYSSVKKIIEKRQDVKWSKDNTYYVLCILEFSKENLKKIVDVYAQNQGFFETDKNRLEYLYNHLVIVDISVLELFFMYDNCYFLEDLINMKTNLKTRFDFLYPNYSGRRMLKFYNDIFEKKYTSLMKIINESEYLFYNK